MFDEKKYRKEYYLKNKIKLKKLIKLYRKRNQDKVRKWNKTYNEFHKEHIKNYFKVYRKNNSLKIKKWFLTHKKEIKESQKQYRKTHKEQIGIKGKEYYQKHKDQIKKQVRKYAKIHKIEKQKYMKQYKINNRNKIRQYFINKLKTDVNFKIRINLKNRIWGVLKGNSKSKSTLKLLGCSIKHFKQHLENQFKPGMSWDNYGSGWNGKGMQEWHIDHIRPCISFDLQKKSEQHKCFNYTNLRPLWAKENLSRKRIFQGDKI